MLTERQARWLAEGVRGGAIDGNHSMFEENAGAVYNAREYRRLFDRLFMSRDLRSAGGLATSGAANGGITRSYDLAVTQRGAGANMSVDVALGGALVGGTENAHQGEYFVYSDATVNVAIAAADATNPRIDIVGIRVRDQEYSGGTDDAQIVVVTGTPAGAPAEPTLPDNFLSLARVDVAALAASIVNANITDRRQRGGPNLVPHTRAVRRVMANNNTFTNQTTWADFPNATDKAAMGLTFTKHWADTRLIFRADFSAELNSGAAQLLEVGLSYNGTDYAVAAHNFEAATVRRRGQGMVEVTGIAAGSHAVKPRFKAEAASSVTLYAGDDIVSYSVEECL